MAPLKAANFLMGLVLIGVVGGCMLMYRNGWPISKGSLAANIFIAILLLAVGFLFFQEKISLSKSLALFFVWAESL